MPKYRGKIGGADGHWTKLLHSLREAMHNWSPCARFSLSPLGGRGQGEGARVVYPKHLSVMQVIRQKALAAAPLLVAVLLPPCRLEAAAAEGDGRTFRGPAGQESPATNAVTVAKTHDGRPFEYRLRGQESSGGCQILKLSYPSPVTSPLPQNNTVPAELFLPANLAPGEGGRPAVICLPILNGDEDLTAMLCSVLAARGVPALMFKLPYYGERGPAEGRRALAANPALFINAIEQAGAEVRRAVDLLASRPEINPERVGIAGISLGGIMAASAAGADPRLYRASLMLAGGDLPTIIHHAGETRQLSAMIKRLPPAERAAVEAKLESIDPLRHAPALRERAGLGRVLMLNAGQDEVIPRVCTEKLAAALGLSNQVVWFEGLGHYTALAELPRALRLTADFFAQDLPPGVKPVTPSIAPTNATQRLLTVVQQLVTMTTTAPATGRCHFLEGELAGHDQRDRPLAADFRLVIGAGGQFMVRIKSPPLGELAAGHGEFPWFLAPVGGVATVFAGTAEPAAGANLFTYVDPAHLVKQQLLAGAAGALMLAPDLAQRWVAAEWLPVAGGEALRVTPREARNNIGELTIRFPPGSSGPGEISFKGDAGEGVLKVRGWQTNTIAPPALFEPPGQPPRRAVSARDLLRHLAALLNEGGDQLKLGGGAKSAPNPDYPRLKLEEFLKIYAPAKE